MLLADRGARARPPTPAGSGPSSSSACPGPRDRHAPRFEALVDTVYGILTGREQAAVAALEDGPKTKAAEAGSAPPRKPAAARRPARTLTSAPLPDVSPGGLVAAC